MTTTRSNVRSGPGRPATVAVCTVFILSLLAAGVFADGQKFGFTRAAGTQEEEAGSVAKQSASGKGLRCSNSTLKGGYATRGDGFVPAGPPPAPLVPFAAVSLMTLDGSGNLATAGTISINGVVSSNVNSGTYSVNEDCTGKMTILLQVAPFQLNFDLVVADKGREFYLIATTPSVVTVAGKQLQ